MGYLYPGIMGRMLQRGALIPILGLTSAISAAPPGFPASGNGIWFKTGGVSWSKEWLPIGNGYIAGKTVISLGLSKFADILW